MTRPGDKSRLSTTYPVYFIVSVSDGQNNYEDSNELRFICMLMAKHFKAHVQLKYQ